MKRILGITTAALMGASVLAAPAFAQADQNSQLGGEQNSTDTMTPGTDTMTPDVDTGTTAAIGGSIDGALAAIGNNEANAQSISSMTTVDTVNVVRIGDLEGSDPALIEQTVTQNAEGVEALRNSIAANPALSQQLETQGVGTASVIGAELGAAGEVTLYVM